MVPFGRSLPQIAAGVAQEDRAALCRQHYTSKLRTVDDLQRELAFGFRGEALHSMSEVAGEVRCEQTRLPGLGADARRQVTVLTKTEADEMGEQLVFNCSGELLSRAPRASATGTVVRVGRLFARTPVRRRMAAEKARKRAEDAETQRILVAYGLALPPLKLSLRSADAVPPRAWNKPAVESLDAAVSSCLGARVLVNNQRIAGSGTVRDAGSEQSDARGAEEEEGGEEEAVVTVEASLPRAGGDVGTVSRSRPTDLHFFLNSRCVHANRRTLRCPTTLTDGCAPYAQTRAYATSGARHPRRLLSLLPALASRAVAGGRTAPAPAPALRGRQPISGQAPGGPHLRAGPRALRGGPGARRTAADRRPGRPTVEGIPASLHLFLPLPRPLHGGVTAWRGRIPAGHAARPAAPRAQGGAEGAAETCLHPGAVEVVQ